MVIFTCLFVVVANLLPRVQTDSCEEALYVKLSQCDEQADVNDPCGSSAASPCPSISAALKFRQQYPASVCIRLLTPAIVDCERGLAENLSDVENAVIEPWPMSGLEGQSLSEYCFNYPQNCEVQLRVTGIWISLTIAWNVTVRYVSVNLNEHATAVYVSQSSYVSVSNCTFSNVTKDTHALWIQNSWPVTISSTNFNGESVSVLAPMPGQPYNMSALLVEYTCSDVSDGCSSRLPDTTSSMLIYDSHFSNITFSNLGAVMRQTHALIQATAMHLIVTRKASRPLVVLVQSSTFIDNKSPYDSAVRVFFANESGHSHVQFRECTFSDSAAYMGGALYLQFGTGVNNTVTLSTSSFTRNVGFIEAGVARVSFWSSNGQSGQLVVEDCHFYNNQGGVWAPVLGGVFVFTTVSDLLAENAKRDAMTRKQIYITNSTFSDNHAAIAAVMYLQRSRIEFCNW